MQSVNLVAAMSQNVCPTPPGYVAVGDNSAGVYARVLLPVNESVFPRKELAADLVKKLTTAQGIMPVARKNPDDRLRTVLNQGGHGLRQN